MDESGNPVIRNGTPVVLVRSVLPSGVAEWSLANAGTTLGASADAFFGSKFYLKLTRNPPGTDPLDLALTMKTDLTWLYGPQLGGSPGKVHCNNSQEVGDDEIWMAALPNDSGLSFPSNANATTELNGAFDEGDNDEWTAKLFKNYLGGGRRPRAARFTKSLTVRFYEDDSKVDETADRTYKSLAIDKVGPQHSPSGDWDFPKASLINTGDNYEGEGPTLSHYLEGRPCETNDDCQAPLVCGGSLCVRP